MSDHVTINETEIPVRAYLHRTADTCVTAAVPSGELVYDSPRKLIAWEDIADQVDWLEKGVVEWRDVAVRTREASLALLEALEWLISNEPSDSPKRGVLVARAAIAQAKGVLHV
jgi:hypothetical protein